MSLSHFGQGEVVHNVYQTCKKKGDNQCHIHTLGKES